MGLHNPGARITARPSRAAPPTLDIRPLPIRSLPTPGRARERQQLLHPTLL